MEDSKLFIIGGFISMMFLAIFQVQIFNLPELHIIPKNYFIVYELRNICLFSWVVHGIGYMTTVIRKEENKTDENE